MFPEPASSNPRVDGPERPGTDLLRSLSATLDLVKSRKIVKLSWNTAGAMCG